MWGCLKKHHGLAVLWLLVGACGSQGRWQAEQIRPAAYPEASPQARTGQLPANTLGDSEAFGVRSRPVSSAALELSLADGTVIPTSVKASSLVAKFRASEADASFECAREASEASVDWRPCLGGDSYDFGRLIHRQGYSLRVRARTPDGRLSPALLSINFVADLVSGTSPHVPFGAPKSQAPEVNLPQSAIDLPLPTSSDTTLETGPALSRSLQVGSYYAVNVPPTARVITYASNKTYNGRKLTITVLNQYLSDLFIPTKSCRLAFEKVVTVADGTEYCESTPTPADVEANGPVIAPMNYVTLTLGQGNEQMRETMTFGVFDDASEGEAEAKMTLTQCRANLAHGTTAMAIVPQFYGVTKEAHITWCQFTDANGAWWWGAVVSSKLNEAADGPHIKMVYLASASLGVVSQTQFLDRVRLKIAPLLQPIAAAI